MDREIVPICGEMLTPSESFAHIAEMENLSIDESLEPQINFSQLMEKRFFLAFFFTDELRLSMNKLFLSDISLS